MPDHKTTRRGKRRRTSKTRAIDERLLALAQRAAPPPPEQPPAAPDEPAGEDEAPAADNPLDGEPRPHPSDITHLSDHEQRLVLAIGPALWQAMTRLERLMIRALLMERGSVTPAAMRCGLRRSYHYADNRTRAYQQAAEIVQDVLHDIMEDSIVSRGYRGTEKIVRHKGFPVPITDPRVPVLTNPETGQAYMVPDPRDPETMIPFRGWESEVQYSDTIGLHVLKSIRPDKWDGAQKVQLEQIDGKQLTRDVAMQAGVDLPEGDAVFDQSHKLDAS